MENASSFQHFGKASNNFHEVKTCGFGSHLEAILDHLGERQRGPPRHQWVSQKIVQIIMIFIEKMEKMIIISST